MLLHEDHSRWYFLSFDGEQKVPAIRLGIYGAFVRTLSTLISDFQKNDLFFETDISKGYGVDRALTTESASDEYVILRADFSDRRKLVSIAESFSEIFSILNAAPHVLRNEFATDPVRLQLMEVQSFLRADMSMGGAPLGGDVSPAFTHWIEEKHKRTKTLRAVEEAM